MNYNRNISTLYFLANKIFKAICYIIFFKFVQSSFSDGTFIPSQLYLVIKSLIIFFILVDLFIFLHDLARLLKCIDNICYLFSDVIFCCFFFLSIQKNLYTIHRNLDLFYDIYNGINKHNQRSTHYLSSIVNHFNIFF